MTSLNESADGVSGRDQYRALAARRILILVGLFLALCFSMAADMALGPARYTLSEVLATIADPAAVGNQLRW